MSQDSLVRFSDAIITDAEEKRRDYIEKLRENKKAALDAKKAELKREYDEYVRGECTKHNAEAGLEASRHRNGLRRELILKRNAMFDEIFSEVTENIVKYAESAEYIEKTKKMLKEAMKGFPRGKTVCVARECDIPKLREAAADAEFESADSGFLGGFSLRNDEMKLFLDCTLNTRIEKQKKLFVGNSGLIIE